MSAASEDSFVTPREARNSYVQAWFTIAMILFGIAGMVTVGFVVQDGGLFRVGIVGAWYATFDFANAVFMLLWVVTLSDLRVNDGMVYRLRFGRHRPSHRAGYDAAIFATFAIVAVAWGIFVFRPALTARARDGGYVVRQAVQTGLTGEDGVQHLLAGVEHAMIAYWVVIGLVLAGHAVGLFFNPVDLPTMDARVKRMVRAGRYGG